MTGAIVRRSFFSEEHSEEQEDIVCPGCRSESMSPLVETEDWLLGKPGRYRFQRCDRCALVSLNPRPAPAALGAHYPTNYFCYTRFEDEPWLLRKLAGDLQTKLSLQRLRYVERAFGTLRPGLRVVDVGCGRGDLLDCFRKERGCSVVGIDFDEGVAKQVREKLGIEVFHGTLRSAAFEPESRDLITMCEYLEHEPDPRGVLEEAHRVLSPGGHVAIEVPDVSGPPARLFRSNWWQLDAPRHLVLFTPPTLQELLRTTGFEVVRVTRFGRVASMGYSLLQLFGFRYATSNHTVFLILATAFGLPFVPLLRLLPDFMFVVARKKA